MVWTKTRATGFGTSDKAVKPVDTHTHRHTHWIKTHRPYRDGGKLHSRLVLEDEDRHLSKRVLQNFTGE